MATIDPPPAPAPVPEPYEGGELRLRWWVVPLAAVVATVAVLLAPDGWPSGVGRLTVEYRDAIVVDAPVMIGSDAPVSLDGERSGERSEERSGARDGVTVRIRFDEGLPTDDRLEGVVQVWEGEAAVRPTLSDLRVALHLPDGREELIPVLRWDDEARELETARRPPLDAAVVLALLAVVVVLWVTETVPLWVTSLGIPVVLAVSEVAGASAALAPFFHPIIALFFGGFLMAEAMRRVGLDRLAAVNLVARFGRSPATLFAAMIAVSAFLSMWMSNTASTAVLIPIALAVTAPFEGGGYRRAVVLGIAYAATIGGVGSAIGTPANPLAIEFLDEFADRQISFVEWFPLGLPMVVLFLPVMGVYLWWRMRARVDPAQFAEARRVAVAQLAEVGPPQGAQLTVLAVFAGVMALWLTQTWHDLNTGIIALIGALALAGLGYVRTDDLGRISWASLLTFGGGLTLGTFLVESGTADWLAVQFEGLEGLPELPALAAVAALALALTTVASNTATAAMLIPLAIPLAGVLGIDPLLLVVTVAIASSVDFALVIGTPPTMLAYSTRLFTAPQILRIGGVLDVVGIVLLVTLVGGIWRGLGLV